MVENIAELLSKNKIMKNKEEKLAAMLLFLVVQIFFLLGNKTLYTKSSTIYFSG